MSVLNGSVILITGGTGSFGQAFVKFALKHDVRKVIIYSRDEYKQSQLELNLNKDDRLRFYLGDVRDLDRLEMAFYGVDYVIHAAALKRVEKCEADPLEAIKTNVFGSTNVIEAALKMGVKRVVALSTDKACSPQNVYGATKLLMEKLIIAANNISGGRCHFSVVRFGNIWASRGSVVDRWVELSQQGKSVPITDPDATRFYMTTDQVNDLVMDALSVNMFLFTPKELKAFRLSDLAKAMAVKTEIIGLPLFEKLHEEFGDHKSSMVECATQEELRTLKY